MSVLAESSLTNYVNAAVVVVDGKVVLPRSHAETTVIDLLKQRGHSARDARNVVNNAMSAAVRSFHGNIFEGMIYLVQFRDACNRVGLNFTMPAMNITVDDDDADDNSRAQAESSSAGQHALLVWDQGCLDAGTADLEGAGGSSASGGAQSSQLVALAQQVCSSVARPRGNPSQVSDTDLLEVSESDISGDGNEDVRREQAAAAAAEVPMRTRKPQVPNLRRARSSFSDGSSCRSRSGHSEISADCSGALVSASVSPAGSQLLEVCSQQRRQLAFKATSVQAKNTLIKQLKRKVQRLESENKKLKRERDNDPNKEFIIQKKGQQKLGKAGRFTRSSWFSIALRKCLTNIASADFGLATMADISGSTVLRSEVKTAAGLVHCFHLFMAEALDFVVSCNQSGDRDADAILPLGLPSLEQESTHPGSGNENPDKRAEVPANVERSPDSARTWSLVAVGFRSDATNANVWRRKKLSVAFCKVLWIQNFDELKRGNFEKAAVVRQSVHLVNALV